MATRSGIVYLVGAGPGDPGLLTLRGAEVLRGADVVLYDQLSNERLLDLAPPEAVRVFAGKARGRCPVRQEEINALMVEHARLGRVVVRLKGGDPYVFGRGAEEAGHLAAAGVGFEVVPGVTAAVGASAYAGIPLTHRDDASAVAFLTGHADPVAEPDRYDWKALAAFPGTLVFYMGYRHHATICRMLVEHGLPATTPAALVQAGSLPSQRVAVGMLADLPERALEIGITSPALLIIGAVVGRRGVLGWYERLPLFGRRVVVTRPGEGERMLEALGAEVLAAPMVAIRAVEDPRAMDDAIDRIESFDWIVFTSANGVRSFLDRIEGRGLDLRVLGRSRLAAIGPATAEALREYRLRADLVPSSFRSEGLVEALRPLVGGGRVLLARADRGRALLNVELELVAEVEMVAVYRNVDAEALPEEAARRLENGSIDWVTLTSPAIVERFAGLIGPEARQGIASGAIRLASISALTSGTIRRLGWPVAAEATDATWEGVVGAIVAAERT